METRVERDARGELRIPRRAYWGIGSGRTLKRGVQAQRYPRRLIHGVAAVIRAAAMVAEDLERLRVDEGEWVAAAAQELADALLDVEIVVDAAADPRGVLLVQNAREVIANRANELMGGAVGTGNPIHPERKVAAGYDPAGIFRLGAAVGAAIALREDLIPTLDGPSEILAKRALDRLCVLDPRVLGADDGTHARLVARLAVTLGIDFLVGEPEPRGAAVVPAIEALEPGEMARAALGLAHAARAAEAAAPELVGVYGPLLVQALATAAQR